MAAVARILDTTITVSNFMDFVPEQTAAIMHKLPENSAAVFTVNVSRNEQWVTTADAHILVVRVSGARKTVMVSAEKASQRVAHAADASF